MLSRAGLLRGSFVPASPWLAGAPAFMTMSNHVIK